jgi:hypothetical protein
LSCNDSKIPEMFYTVLELLKLSYIDSKVNGLLYISELLILGFTVFGFFKL